MKRLEERRLREAELEKASRLRVGGEGGGGGQQQQDMMTQKQCLEELRKCVEKVPIPAVRKTTLNGISKVTLLYSKLGFQRAFT